MLRIRRGFVHGLTDCSRAAEGVGPYGMRCLPYAVILSASEGSPGYCTSHTGFFVAALLRMTVPPLQGEVPEGRRGHAKKFSRGGNKAAGRGVIISVRAGRPLFRRRKAGGTAGQMTKW